MSQEMISDSIAICKTTENPVKLSWENLNYEVDIAVSAKDASGKSSNKLNIIKNVSGYAMPG
jgi:hypothetical protein